MSARILRVAPAVFLLLWSTGFGVASIALRYADVGTVLAVRYAVVIAVLVPVLAVLRPRLPRGGEWGRLAAVGALVQLAYFAMNWTALQQGLGVAVVALIGAAQPILVAIASPLFGGVRPDRRMWLGLALGVAGAAVVILARATVSAPPLAPLLLAVVSTCCLSAGTVLERQWGTTVHPLMGALVQYAVGFAGTAALALLTEPDGIRWSVPFVGAVAYLAVGNSLVAITLLLMMMARGEVARVSALFFLVPPVAAAEAFVLTGERLPPLAWAGMAVAAAGVALATRPRRPTPVPTPTPAGPA